jgi:hypothetical protein
LEELGLTKDDVFEYISNKYPKSKSEIKFDPELKKWVIHVYNNEDCTEDMILSEEINGIKILNFSVITTWKKEAIKNIGGEDAFNQEYDLRFINSSRNVIDEVIIDDLMKNKKDYVWRELPKFNNLKFSYKDLQWIDDLSIFDPNLRRDYKLVLSVDISEGLGQDYSVINIFKISPKDFETIERQKHKYKSIVDFIKLDQIGMFRSNLVSVSQLADLLYLICFEYFNPDNVKVVLEINTYGNELLAHLPNVFDGKNEYGSSIFFRYKHRHDSVDEKIGIKIGDNKNLLVKEYQDRMDMKSIWVNNIQNISEITTFIKHVTPAGNIRYAADGSSNDDMVMTLISMSSVFGKTIFSQMVDEFANQIGGDFLKAINDFQNGPDWIDSIDYKQVLDIRKRRMNRDRSDVSEGNLNDWIARFRR